jgi:hypothetical protein
VVSGGDEKSALDVSVKRVEVANNKEKTSDINVNTLSGSTLLDKILALIDSEF